jgi:thiol-disulfide isomerase/thioredoxin
MKRLTAYIISLFFIMLSTNNIAGQAGYKITFDCNGLKNTTVKLAFHLGNSQYLKDSLVTNSKGVCTFTGKEKLSPGVYMIVLPGNKYFEFLAEEDQVFKVSCKYNASLNITKYSPKDKTLSGKLTTSEITELKFEGSELNQRFITYQKDWQALQDKDSDLKKEYQNKKDNPSEQEKIRKAIVDQEFQMKAWLTTEADKNRGTLLGAIIKSIVPVNINIQEVPAGVNNPDSVKQFWSYIYYKNHFFDNTELTNPGLIRSPVLATKLDQFFNQVVVQSSDSINKEIDLLLKKCEAQKEVFQYVTSWVFNKYTSSQYMGHDAVVLHIADSVYLAGKAPWASNEFIADLAKKANRLRPNLIGMKAADLVMNSFSGNFVSLYDIKAAFTILYFWEPDCGHCKEATPLLKDYYDKNRNAGIEVFAVCTKDDKEKWEKYITEHNLTWINGWDPERLSHFDYFYNVESTPLVYILDKDKKIIAKRLSVENIGPFIKSYREFQKTQEGKEVR